MLDVIIGGAVGIALGYVFLKIDHAAIGMRSIKQDLEHLEREMIARQRRAFRASHPLSYMTEEQMQQWQADGCPELRAWAFKNAPQP
jgi:hypothetical protein